MSETKIKDGGPAFPFSDELHGFYPGMTLRDWFAGQALKGAISGMDWEDFIAMDFEEVESVCCKSYIAASAMLAERERK